eukprot:gene9760-13129_t
MSASSETEDVIGTMVPLDVSHVGKEFIAGGSAGSIGVFIGFPFDLVKVKLQSNLAHATNAGKCIRQIFVEEGLSGFYKGCLPPVITQGMINSLMFVGEGVAMRYLEPNLKPGEVGTPLHTFIAGSFGGFLQCFVLVPSDVVKCSMQAEASNISSTVGAATKHYLPYVAQNLHKYKKNIFSKTILYTKGIYHAEGLIGFYKGFSVTALREIPSIGLYFFTYKNVRDLITKYQKRDIPSTEATLLSGGIAGALSWTVIYPVDVIKTNIQVSDASLYRGMSIFKVAQILYKQHGSKVFFKGLGTTICRAFPVNASTFYFYEMFKHEWESRYN